MNTPRNYTAAALGLPPVSRYIPRPPVRTLAELPTRAPRLLQAMVDYPLAKARWEHWTDALAPFHPAHEPYAEDDTAHWFQEERWVDQPPVDPPFQPFALLSAWSVTTELPAAGLNVSPLVNAAKEKEAEMLLKVVPSADCLKTAPAHVAADRPEPLPEPIDAWEVGHQLRLQAAREHIRNIARDYAATVRAREAQAVQS